MKPFYFTDYSKIIRWVFLLSLWVPEGFCSPLGKDCTHFLKNLRGEFEKLEKYQRLPYCYYFEICELPELPEFLREATFHSLSTVGQYFSGIKETGGEALYRFLQKSKKTKIIELGSGSGHGLSELHDFLEEKIDFEMIATDLFPQKKSWEREFEKRQKVKFYSTSVSFENFHQKILEKDLEESTLLIISAFHHVENVHAKTFFKNAERTKSNIMIIEPFQRDVLGLLTSLGSTFSSLLTPVLSQHISFSKRMELAVFHWAIPIVPIIFAHDGVVSTLRQRSLEDWKEIISETRYQVSIKNRQGPLRNFSILEFSI